jgi:hypothetical protein
VSPYYYVQLLLGIPITAFLYYSAPGWHIQILHSYTNRLLFGVLHFYTTWLLFGTSLSCIPIPSGPCLAACIPIPWCSAPVWQLALEANTPEAEAAELADDLLPEEAAEAADAAAVAAAAALAAACM